ncbi:MAG: AAA family ATPase, partial [Bryobacteraceae bacterium]
LDVLHRSGGGGLDADLWRSLTTPAGGVDVLLAPDTLAEGINEFTDPGPIIEYARYNYEAVILDAASVYGEWNLALARLADEVLLITTNELPALQATQRALSYLDSNRVGRWKIRLVVNRYEREVGLRKDVIGTALHTDVFHLIPSDQEPVQRALMEGRAIPANSAFGRTMRQLGDRLAGHEEPVKKGSPIMGLLSLFSRTSL